MSHAPDRPIRVLHADDDPDFGAMVAEFLTRQPDRLDVEAHGVDRLRRCPPVGYTTTSVAIRSGAAGTVSTAATAASASGRSAASTVLRGNRVSTGGSALISAARDPAFRGSTHDSHRFDDVRAVDAHLDSSDLATRLDCRGRFLPIVVMKSRPSMTTTCTGLGSIGTSLSADQTTSNRERPSVQKNPLRPGTRTIH